MRRSFAFIFALLLCATLAFPAFAAVSMDENVAQKEAPGIVSNDDGSAAILYDAEGNELMRITMEDLFATGLGEVEASLQIDDEAEETLKNAYQKFLNPDAMLSIQASAMNEVALDVLGMHSTADSFAVWNMFDLSMRNQEVLEKLKEKGAYVQVTFDLGEEGNSVIASMVYANDKWFNVELINNGDGTVTCKFTLFGTVVFFVPFGNGGPGGEEDGEIGGPNDDTDDEDFVPSVGYKPIPGLTPGEGGFVGGIVHPDGTVDPVDPDCFSFISVNQTEKPAGTLIEQERVLRSVFNVMNNPNVKLSMVAHRMNEVAERLLGAGHDADDFVIRDLFYMDLICEEHADLFPAEGVQMKLVFDLGIDPDAIITGMVFVDGEWMPVEATNNGDDTVTFLFDDICPVAFLVAKEQMSSPSAGVLIGEANAQNAEAVTAVAAVATANGGIWMVTGLGSLVAMVALAVVYLRAKKREMT